MCAAPSARPPRRAKSCGAAVEATKLPQLDPNPRGSGASKRPSSVGPSSRSGGGVDKLPPIGPALGSVGGFGVQAHRVDGKAAPQSVACEDSMRKASVKAGENKRHVQEKPPSTKGYPSNAAFEGDTFTHNGPANTSSSCAKPPLARRASETRISSESHPTSGELQRRGRGTSSPCNKAPAAAPKTHVGSRDSSPSKASSKVSEAPGPAQPSKKGTPDPSSASALDKARDFVSDGMRKVMDEEKVIYSWRRKEPGAAKSSVDAVNKQDQCNSNQRPSKGVRSPVASPTVEARKPEVANDSGTRSPNQLKGQGTGSCDSKDQHDAGSSARPSSASNKPASRSGARSPSVSNGGSRGSSNRAGAPVSGRPPKPRVQFQVPTPSKSESTGAIVPAGPRTGSRSTAKGGPSGTAGSSGTTSLSVDLDELAQQHASRLDTCSRVTAPKAVKLVAYDGSAPQLGASLLGRAPVRMLQLWLEGKASGELVCLQVEDWTQGEVVWPEAPGGALQRRLGVVAGMLADASLQRDVTSELRQRAFSQSPPDCVNSAFESLLKAAPPRGGELLTSEVEHALAKEEARSFSEGPAARLEHAVRKEIFRFLWSAGQPSDPCDLCYLEHNWLISELARSPEAIAAAARSAPAAQLRSENAMFDAYLIRLLRLKRALALLLDEWEKVDHYAILGVPSTASDKELKNAYRKACLRLHPDKGGDKAQFQQLQDAYGHILEERANAKSKAGQDSTKSGGQSSTAENAGKGPQASAKSNGSAGVHLALEGGNSGEGVRKPEEPEVPEAAEEVVAADQRLNKQVAEVMSEFARAEAADAKVQELRQANHAEQDGVSTLRADQDAGETLLNVADVAGSMGPQLGESAMEVAESSLGLAARFAAVPSSLLLTDVALSCTFAASCMQHAAKQLLDVQRDTILTLQTLKTNLDMARLIGTVDADTLRLSLGLVGKAASRIAASLKLLANAVSDASQRGKQCSAHARSVAGFAARRAAAAAEEDLDENHGMAALPPTSPCEANPPPRSAQETSAEDAPPQGQSSAEGTHAHGSSSAPQVGEKRQPHVLVETRIQNSALFRQLNTTLVELQRRARTHLAKKGGVAGLTDVSQEAKIQSLHLACEVVLEATEQAVTEFVSAPSSLEQVLKKCFSFVEACGSGLAMPVDMRTQLVRLAALLDAQAILAALEKQAKPRLTECCLACAESERAGLMNVLDHRFDLLSNAIISARI